ncbi:hypothetical protein HYS97_00740 [Candidatus Daviesbacteria bacterium]|nr:hypothetical protein [Candidatus Daviesbacteria bacterium]
MKVKLLVSSTLEDRKKVIEEILKTEKLTIPHPDLLYFGFDQKLGVEAAKQIRQHLSLKPYQAKGRAVVLESAYNLTLEAQNALLKTLEEPFENSLILLGVKTELSLIPTILSRCEILNIPTPTTSNPGGLINQYEANIEKLQNQSIQERFEYIEKLEDKEVFLKALTSYFRKKLKEDFKYLDFTKKLLEAEQWKEANVNLRAILEYLMLIFPKNNE